jgi:hypothetical protein
MSMSMPGFFGPVSLYRSTRSYSARPSAASGTHPRIAPALTCESTGRTHCVLSDHVGTVFCDVACYMEDESTGTSRVEHSWVACGSC